MVIFSLSEAAQAKNFDSILGLTRMLPDGKNWIQLDKDDIENIVGVIMKRYSDNGKETSTTSDFKRFLRIWFRFVKFGSRSFKRVGDLVETRDIETKPVEHKITREQLITSQDKKRLVDACVSLRDKALIDIHYDAGTRIGEILSVQIKHIVVDENGVVISVKGKTGSRKIRILESVLSLAKWLETHPDPDNPEAYLFCNMKHVWRGNKLSYPASVRILNKACKNAGIRHLNWHMFRHSEATRTAQYMSDAILKKRHGWSPTSKMAARYAHINNSDVDEAYLRHHGIEPKESNEVNTVPVICLICKTPNSHDSTVCNTCAKPLTTDKAILLENKEQEKYDELSRKYEKLESAMSSKLEFVLEQISFAQKLFEKSKKAPDEML